jgi:two-component system sensor histidine kinase GlrK
MGLASKFFLVTSLVVLLFLMVASWSLLVVSHLVDVNRAITTRTLPAVKLEASLRQPLERLFQLATRYEVLQDSRYGALWSVQVNGVTGDIDQLRDYLTTADERKQHRKLVAAFALYRARVANRLAVSPAAQAPDRAARESMTDTRRLRRGLARLLDATSAAGGVAREQARALEHRTWSAVALAFVASVCGALLAVGLIAQRMKRTLRRLSTATADVARGSFTGPIRVRRRDELGELADAFNRMAGRLSEMDRLKQEFFSHVSHELRTPLTAAREAVHLLDEGVAGELAPKQARLIEIIGTSTDRMLRLVNRILELSRLEAGLLTVDRRWVDLDALVERAVRGLLPQAEVQGVVIERDGARSHTGVAGDPERLLEVVENLLGNAIKFTPAGGRVNVRLADGRDQVEIVVEDNGVGIPAEALGRIFGPYWQVRNARGGTGLGLAIVKGIVEAHGGRVRAVSAEGQGSRFTVTLPRKSTA